MRHIARLPKRGLTLPSSGLAPAWRFRPSFHSGPYAPCRREPLMSNVRPKANQVGAKVQARAIASSSSPQALHALHVLCRTSRTSTSCSGCPSFGGQRTLVAARTRYALAHANRVSSSEQTLKSTFASSQGARSPNCKNALAASSQARQPVREPVRKTKSLSALPRLSEESPFQSLVALQRLWCRPPRPNPSVERTRSGRPLQDLISFWALRVLPARAAHLKR